VSGTGGAVVGLGMTAQGRRLGVSDRVLRRSALELALEDAGLARRDIDGYILVGSGGFEDHRYLGLSPHFSYSLQSGGASPALSVLSAIGAVLLGQANYVACVYGEAFTSSVAGVTPASAGPAREARDIGSGAYGYPYLFGQVGPVSAYAQSARRHMHRYGTTSPHLGAVAVQERAYGCVRPGTIEEGQPITLDDHQRSRLIVEPFRLLDCCRSTDGGVAIIVTSAERAADCRARPVDVLGIGSGHGIRSWHEGIMFDDHDVGTAAATAFGQAGVAVGDVDVAELYAPFSFAVIAQLEEYGFCARGEGGPFVAAGETGPGGAIPTNTGGGHLSGFYATGFTPLSEGILQARGDAPTNQIPDVEVVLVSGSGGNAGINGSSAHATLLLGARR
jgi:acetyl-CoA acetyltransferase